MAPRTVYANLLDGLNPLALWDQSLADMGNLGVIPCTAVGTNAIVLTPIAAVFAPNVTIPQSLQVFSFVAVANSSGSITVQIGTQAAKNLYRMDGTTQATTGDLLLSVTYVIAYNAALNSNAGGFQILAPITLSELPSAVSPKDLHSWALLGATTWNAVNADGTSVSTAGSTTSGIQEAVNASLTGLGTANSDLYIHGGDGSSGGARVAQMSTTLNFPAAQGKRVDIGSVTLNSNSGVGATPGINFDSQEMMEFSIRGGQHVYQGTSAGTGIRFKPSSGTPLDGLHTIGDSSFWFTAPSPVSFDWTGNGGVGTGATNNYFDFGEMNYSDAQNGTASGGSLFVPSVASGQNFGYNMFRSRHVHGVFGTGTAWKVGNGAPAGGQTFGANMYELNINSDSSVNANGIDTYESNSFYVVNIAGITGGVPINLRSGANKNIVINPFNSAPANNVDNGTANFIWGNGVLQGGTGSQFLSLTAGGGINSGFYINSNQPAYSWRSSGAGADQKVWDAVANSGGSNQNVLSFRTINDAINAATEWMTVTRGSGIALTSIRLGAASTLLGQPDAGAPVAQTVSVQNVVAGTSNTAGAVLSIAGSQGTGTGLGGAINLRVAPPGTTGSAQNALVTGAALIPSATAPGGMTWAQGVGPFVPWSSAVAEWRTGTNQRFALGAANLLATGVSFNVFDDPISVNLGLEFRASTTAFTQGGVHVSGTPTTQGVGVILASASIKSSGATSGIGYATGAGGTVTQATSKATGVTLSTASGAITMNAAALAAGTIVSFVLTNTAIAATDVLILNHISGGTLGSYLLNAACAAGSATIYVRNETAGSLSEAIVIQFVLIKGVNA